MPGKALLCCPRMLPRLTHTRSLPELQRMPPRTTFRCTKADGPLEVQRSSPRLQACIAARSAASSDQ